MKPNIKITSFKRESLTEKPQSHHLIKNQISINFIFYTPNKRLSFAEKIVKEKKKQRDDIGFSKCTKVQALNYAIQTCPVGIPVFCIFDAIINQEIMSAFIKNRTAVQNREYFTLALLLEDLQDVPKGFYGVEGLDLITCEESKIIDFLQTQLNKKQLKSQASLSSINSKDVNDISDKFKTVTKVTIQKSETPRSNQYCFADQSPGYKYNKPEKQKIVGTPFFR